jgi:diguanylate cyclase (GGDEF)-like protein/PAS domain S-box-containing protein
MLNSSLIKLLEADNPFLQTVMDALPIAVFYKDADGVYLGCNRAFEQLINVRREEFIGKSVFDLYPEEDARLYHRKDQELFDQDGVQIYEALIHGVDGKEHLVQFHKRAFHNRNGQVAGLIGAVFDVSNRKLLEQRLSQLASHDELTGIYNHYEAIRQLKQAVESARQTSSPVGVILLDIDHFDKLHELHDRETVDLILAEVVRHLPRCCRPTDLIARFDGEEFLIILPDTDTSEARHLAERIRLCLGLTPLRLQNGEQVTLTASLGLSIATSPDDDEESLLHQASVALRQAKFRGCNRVVVYSPPAKAS